MIERIVVPVDFTPESDRALAMAPVLAQWAGVSVELVSVVAPLDRLRRGGTARSRRRSVSVNGRRGGAWNQAAPLPWSSPRSCGGGRRSCGVSDRTPAMRSASS